MEESDKEIRKLRKKLRQIHKLLTLTRDLNEEEEEKVDRFEELQARLDDLLANKCSDQTKVGVAEYITDEEESGLQSAHPEDEEEAPVIHSEREDPTHEEDEEVPVIRSQEVVPADEEEDATVFRHQGADTAGAGDRVEEPSETRQVLGDIGRREGPTPSKVARHDVKSPKIRADSELKKRPPVSDKNEKANAKVKEMALERLEKSQRETKEANARQAKSVLWWRKRPRYFVQELVGHSDIVLDVSIADGLVASASRDSLVKVWSTDTGLLECTLSGHTEAAQACICVPMAVSDKLLPSLSLSAATRLVISGGGDSSILLWKVSSTLRGGNEMRRLYVFTPVTCMSLIPGDGSLVVAAGTSSGKIECHLSLNATERETARDQCLRNVGGFTTEAISNGILLTAHVAKEVIDLKHQLWDVLSKSQVGCRAVHRSAVTCLRLLPPDSNSADRILSCAQGGEVGVHLVASLVPIFVVGDATPQPGRSPRVPISEASSILPVSAAGEWLLVGDGGSSLKMLRRGFKEIKKIPNSTSEFGACDGLWSVEEDGCQVVFSTAFDVDTGRGFLNVFNLSSPSQAAYLMSLQPKQFSGRFLCLDGERGVAGEFPDVLVTGGIELLLWQRTKPDSDFNTAEVAIGRTISLFRRPDDEWSHAESEASSDEWSAEEDTEDETTENQGRWWCYIL